MGCENRQMSVSELSGRELESLIAKALGDPAEASYLAAWPTMDKVLERHAIQVAPMPGKDWMWCAVVVGRPGGLPPGPWIEGLTPRLAVGRAIVAARFGKDLERK